MLSYNTFPQPTYHSIAAPIDERATFIREFVKAHYATHLEGRLIDVKTLLVDAATIYDFSVRKEVA